MLVVICHNFVVIFVDIGGNQRVQKIGVSSRFPNGVRRFTRNFRTQYLQLLTKIGGKQTTLRIGGKLSTKIGVNYKNMGKLPHKLVVNYSQFLPNYPKFTKFTTNSTIFPLKGSPELGVNVAEPASLYSPRPPAYFKKACT